MDPSSSGQAPLVLTRGASPAEYFERLLDTKRQAERRVGAEERCYATAGCSVRLRFAGPALVASLTRALVHLETAVAPAGPILTVHLWDSESTAITMPPPAWSRDDFREQGKIRGFFDGRFHTMWGSNALSMLDTERNEALFWVKSAVEIPYYERASPLRSVMHLWFARHGVQLVHAAAIGTVAGGALLVGKAGSGKSTASLACLGAGLGHAADDYCLVVPGPPAAVHSIYSSAKLSLDGLERLTFAQAMVSNPSRLGYEKAVTFLAEHRRDQLVQRFALKAVLVPRIAEARGTTLRPASPGSALVALAPSTIMQLPGADGNALRSMARVVASVPCYHLELGTDPAGIAAVIGALLDGRAHG